MTVEVKFCGLTRPIDVKKAVELGADYLGFVTEVPSSPRSISLVELDNHLNFLNEHGIRDQTRVVAVTVDASENLLGELLRRVDVVQLHGRETPKLCGRYRDRITVWKACKTGPEITAATIEPYRDVVDAVLLDTQTADDKKDQDNPSTPFEAYELFETLKAQGYRLILAGGLRPDNVAGYIERLRPDIVDISSGIEAAPGSKDHELMVGFITAVAHADEKI